MIELAFDLVEEFARYLRDPANAEPAGSFPNVPDRADHPGLYAWWADDVGLALLSVPFGEDLPPLIYAGQAGCDVNPVSCPELGDAPFPGQSEPRERQRCRFNFPRNPYGGPAAPARASPGVSRAPRSVEQ